MRSQATAALEYVSVIFESSCMGLYIRPRYRTKTMSEPVESEPSSTMRAPNHSTMQVPAGDDHFHHRRELGLQAAGAQCDADAFHALHFVAPLFVVFAREGAHHAHRGEDLVDDGDHLAFLLAHGPRGFLDLARVGEDDGEQERARWRARSA